MAFEMVQRKFDALADKGIKNGPSLQIVISSQESKSGGIRGSYVEYSLTCTEKDTQHSWEIKKRFSDFSALEKALKKSKKLGPLAPTLKAKSQSIISKNQTTEVRSSSMQNWIQEVVSKPALFYSDEVLTFLEVSSEMRAVVSAIDEILKQPLKEGYLDKEGGNYKNWKRRFCRLYPDWTLLYFETPESSEPKGLVDFQDVQNVKPVDKTGEYPNQIEMKTKARNWCFNAGDAKVRDEWVEAFRMLINNTYKYKEWLPEGGRSFGTLIPGAGGMNDGINQRETEEFENEINRLQTTIDTNTEKENTMRDTIKQLEAQLRAHEKVVKQASAEVQNMLAEMKKQQSDYKERERGARSELDVYKKQYAELNTRNGELENLLNASKLKMVEVRSPRPDDMTFSFDTNKQKVISGHLEKYGKGGRRGAKAKHVIFVAVGKQNYVEWADSEGSESASRMQVIGVSSDPKIIDRELTTDQKLRVFVFNGKDRVAVFLAPSNAERERWLEFSRAAGVLEVARNVD